MTETSRQYWRDGHRYAQDGWEHAFVEPSYYADIHNCRISEEIIKALEFTKTDRQWRILEVGCNCGRNLNYLFESDYKNIEGVEISPAAVEHAWQVFPSIASKITVSDAQSFLAMKPPGSYDLILTQSILMHVPPEDDYLFNQMTRVAKGGLLICEVEKNRGSLSRHKYDRNYKDVFEALGMRQIYRVPERRRTIRVFSK